MPDTFSSHPTRTWPAIRRVGIFWVGYLAILFVASIPKAMLPANWGALVWGLTSSTAIVALTLLLLKQEGRVLHDVGVRVGVPSVGKFVVGVAIGFAVYSLVILSISAIVGPIRLTRVAAPHEGAIVLMLGSTLALSVMEELGFRAYPLRTLVTALGQWRAQAVVAVAFCLSHVAFGWSWKAVALGVLPSAILFGAVALAVGDVVMPIGVHAAMNVARWAVGESAAQGIWTMTVNEHTQGRVALFGPLIGFAVTLLCAVGVWSWQLRYPRPVER